MLSVTGLKKVYADGSRIIEAVRDVSFNVAEGEIFSLLGLQAAAKRPPSAVWLDWKSLALARSM